MKSHQDTHQESETQLSEHCRIGSPLFCFFPCLFFFFFPPFFCSSSSHSGSHLSLRSHPPPPLPFFLCCSSSRRCLHLVSVQKIIYCDQKNRWAAQTMMLHMLESRRVLHLLAPTALKHTLDSRFCFPPLIFLASLLFFSFLVWHNIRVLVMSICPLHK